MREAGRDAFESARPILALRAELLAPLGELEGDALVGGLHEGAELAQVERRERKGAERDHDVLGGGQPIVRGKRRGSAPTNVREQGGESCEDRDHDPEEADAIGAIREADGHARDHRENKGERAGS